MNLSACFMKYQLYNRFMILFSRRIEDVQHMFRDIERVSFLRMLIYCKYVSDKISRVGQRDRLVQSCLSMTRDRSINKLDVPSPYHVHQQPPETPPKNFLEHLPYETRWENNFFEYEQILVLCARETYFITSEFYKQHYNEMCIRVC